MNLNVITENSAQSKYDRQTQFFKLLAHPARLAILDVLRREEACVCHLEAVLGLRQAYISQQLAVLREAGLIHDRREGWNIYYQISDPHIFEILDLVAKVLYPQGAPAPIHQPQRCPCPKCCQTSSDR